MSINPFTFGNPIRDPSRFFGRSQEIRQVVSRLLSSAHESTSIVGERRMGKTSLLDHLAHPDVAPSLGLTPDRYCLVYLDFQGLTDITTGRFWQRAISKMARSSCEPDLVAELKQAAGQSEFDLFDLEDLFDLVTGRGVHVVLLLDEFEYVTQNPNLGADFFGGLRALAIHHGLSLVPATRRELVDLCHSDEIKGSPFFNIFANVVLRPFAGDETAELIRGHVASTDLSITPQEEAFLARLSGGYPFFIQMAGYYWVEGKLRGLAEAALEAFAAREFDQQSDSHFTYLWSHCSDSEKITLLCVLGLNRHKPSKTNSPTLPNLVRLHPRAQHDANSLTKRGLLHEAQDTYSLFSPSFESWISREITAPAEDQESPSSVDGWLAEGGRERLEPVKGALPRFKRKYWPIVGEVIKELSFELIAGVALSKLI